jgi:hypothetical protein
LWAFTVLFLRRRCERFLGVDPDDGEQDSHFASNSRPTSVIAATPRLAKTVLGWSRETMASSLAWA